MKQMMILTAIFCLIAESAVLAQFDPTRFVRGEISGLDGKDIQRLTRMNVDIVNVKGNTATVYLAIERIEQLEKLGYSVSILHKQKKGRRTAGYPSFVEFSARLSELEALYPDICRRVNIGESVQGRELWFMKISANVDIEEDEPEVKLISTMHGDEPVGMVLCLNLITLLLESYGTDQRLTHLVNDLEIWIMPLMNPDGYEMNSRYNAQGKDLNRSFPDRVADPVNSPDGRPVEVSRLMNWASSHSTVLSAGFHTGALVVNYPFDSDPDPSAAYSATPDDRLFFEMSMSYSALNPPMYNSSVFQHGVVNGVQWYTIYGGMQDWNYVWMGCMETTIELSDVFRPDYRWIPDLWEDNREAMITYMQWALKGVRGIVTDEENGEPIEACVKVVGNHFHTYADPDVGDFHRILLPGEYSLQFAAPGYVTKTTPLATVPENGAVRIDVSLSPVQSGDVNADGAVDLRDSIAALRILASDAPQNVHISADVNGDGAVGLPEAVFALQITAEERYAPLNQSLH